VGLPKVESIVDDFGNSVSGKLDLVPDPIKANYGVGAKEGGTNLAKTPVGRSGNILNIVTKNSPTTINGTKFTGHALDQMQARGILSPSAVLDVIKNPARTFLGNTPGTWVFIRDRQIQLVNATNAIAGLSMDFRAFLS